MTIEEKISQGEERFEKLRRTAGLFFAPGLFFLLLLLPFEDLTFQAHRLLAIVGLVVVLWISEAIPIPISAMLGAVLCVVMGVEEERKVLSSFANPIIFLFLGSFVIARAMRLHRLDQRIAHYILSRKSLGRSDLGILLGVAALSFFVSMWISNTATAAMVFPITLGIISSLSETQSGSKNWPGFRIALMLAVAYAASIGGIATPVGTPPNLIGLGMVESILGKEISFFGWMLLALPLALVTLLLLLIYFRFMFKIGAKSRGSQPAVRRDEPGKWTRGQKNTLIAFLTAVSLWIIPGVIAIFSETSSEFYRTFNSHIPEAMAALIGASLLFVLPVDWKKREFTLTWEQAARIDWGTILLFGGGLTLGGLMFSTGLADRIGAWVLFLTGAASLWGITLMAIVVSVLISETTSNTASASMVVPVMIAVSQSAGVSPLPPALGATLGASFGFMLPVSTPPNAIVYSSGLIPITKMIKAGIVLDLIGITVIWTGLRILCPIFGFS